MTIWIIALAILVAWSLLVAACAPIAGRYLANLDRDNRQ
jgi:hypothetical protein